MWQHCVRDKQQPYWVVVVSILPVLSLLSRYHQLCTILSVLYIMLCSCVSFVDVLSDIPKALFSLLLQITYGKDSVLNKALE